MTAGLAHPYRGGGCPSPSNPSVPSGPPSSTARWPRSWCSSTPSSSGPRAGSSPAAATTRGRRCSRRASPSRCCHRRAAACGVDRLRLGGQDDHAVLSRLDRRLDAAAAPDVVPLIVDTIARALCCVTSPSVPTSTTRRPLASGVPVDDVWCSCPPRRLHRPAAGGVAASRRGVSPGRPGARRRRPTGGSRRPSVGLGGAAGGAAAVTTREEERRRLRHRLRRRRPALAAVAMGWRPSARARADPRPPTRRWSGCRRCAPPPPGAASPASRPPAC
jgi:hypothetical protein